MKSNIILCGFMGCGKTTLGAKLAQKYEMSFCDTDVYLENKWGISIPVIFEKYGEERFREMEAEVVCEISAEKNKVIACGGGTVLRQENVDTFQKAGGKIFFLDAPLVLLQERLKNDKKRPLLQQPNRKEVIARLYETRVPQYRRAADITIDAGADMEAVLQKIAEKAEL